MVVCAEGYLFECERRGYLQAGAFVPEVVLEHPEVVTQLHREFVHAGSDVVEAFTYYAHREKLRVIGKEELLEQLNRQALELAREVARRNRHALRRQRLATRTSSSPDDASSAAVRGDVRGAGRLGRRRRRGLRHRRDVLAGARRR